MLRWPRQWKNCQWYRSTSLFKVKGMGFSPSLSFLAIADKQPSLFVCNTEAGGTVDDRVTVDG